MAIEVVILTPALVAAIFVIAAGARFVEARGQANSAAYAAARAASLTTNQQAAAAAGRAAAENSLSQRGLACTHLTVEIDAGNFTPGGDVKATVTCTADLADLAGFGLLPGSKTFRFSALVTLEQHRAFP